MHTGEQAVTFKVWDLPPNKNATGMSMWADPSQAGRVLHLRQAAVDAFGDRSPFVGPVSLEVFIHTTSMDQHKVGDVDNVLGGIMDSLQGAKGSRLNPHPIFEEHKHDPAIPIGYNDDKQIRRVSVEKVTDSGWGGLSGPYAFSAVESSHFVVTVRSYHPAKST
jgi:hypothetical protein